MRQYFFDVKRNGDHLQVLTTYYLNTLNNTNEYYIFCSIERLAVHFIRLLRIPCILINPVTSKLTLYKGSGNQSALTFDPIKFELEKLKNIEKILKKYEEYKQTITNEKNSLKNIFLKKIGPNTNSNNYNNIIIEIIENINTVIDNLNTIKQDIFLKIFLKKVLNDIIAIV